MCSAYSSQYGMYMEESVGLDFTKYAIQRLSCLGLHFKDIQEILLMLLDSSLLIAIKTASQIELGLLFPILASEKNTYSEFSSTS